MNEMKDRGGIVYLLEAGPFHKIGMSIAFDKRLMALGTLPPFDLEVICTIKTVDRFRLEAALHKKFATKRKKGEWFELNNPDIDFIKELASRDADMWVTSQTLSMSKKNGRAKSISVSLSIKMRLPQDKAIIEWLDSFQNKSIVVRNALKAEMQKDMNEPTISDVLQMIQELHERIETSLESGEIITIGIPSPPIQRVPIMPISR